MSGWVRIHREIFKSGVTEVPYCRGYAWVWLIAHAAYEPTQAKIGRHRVNLARGQVCASIRFMATTWGWHPSKVRRFLASLVAEGRAETTSHPDTLTDTPTDTLTDTPPSVITICNYDAFQAHATSTDTLTDTPTDTLTDTNLRKEINNTTLEGAREPSRIVSIPGGKDAGNEAGFDALFDLVASRSTGGIPPASWINPGARIIAAKWSTDLGLTWGEIAQVAEGQINAYGKPPPKPEYWDNAMRSFAQAKALPRLEVNATPQKRHEQAKGKPNDGGISAAFARIAASKPKLDS